MCITREREMISGMTRKLVRTPSKFIAGFVGVEVSAACVRLHLRLPQVGGGRGALRWYTPEGRVNGGCCWCWCWRRSVLAKEATARWRWCWVGAARFPSHGCCCCVPRFSIDRRRVRCVCVLFVTSRLLSLSIHGCDVRANAITLSRRVRQIKKCNRRDFRGIEKVCAGGWSDVRKKQ